MPAKYVWSSNGTRVLSEDYQETHSSPEKCVYPRIKGLSLRRILSPQQQQALLKKAAQERELARSKPGYNSLKK